MLRLCLPVTHIRAEFMLWVVESEKKCTGPEARL